ncbi:MAG: helix-turn-helix domain-containing protein [Cyanobacteria bacterium J06631_6]
MKELPSRQDSLNPQRNVKVSAIIEAVFGCKWSLSILGAIRRGVCRPSAIEREIKGLTPRVSNYYFRRLMELGILEKFVYPEVPPHVEYRLTALGDRMLPIIDAIEQLQNELDYES